MTDQDKEAQEEIRKLFAARGPNMDLWTEIWTPIRKKQQEFGGFWGKTWDDIYRAAEETLSDGK